MIIDRGPEQPRSTSERQIIYSSGTLTMCASPPASPDPFRSPLRQGLRQQPSQPPLASSTPPRPTAPTALSPTKPIHAQTPFSPQKEALHMTPLENMHLAKIKELEGRIVELTTTATQKSAAAEKNAASVEEWRSRALEAEEKLAQCNTSVETEENLASCQRSKLVDDLKMETSFWQKKFDELLEEHSALQARLKSATAQVSLLDKALNTVRGDTTDALAALASAEAMIARKSEEFEAYKKEKEAMLTETASTADAAIAEKDKHLANLTLENQQLAEQVDSLRRQVEKLTATVDTLNAKLEKTEKATAAAVQIVQPLTLANFKEIGGGGSTLQGHRERHLLQEKDINISTSNNSHLSAEKSIEKEKESLLAGGNQQPSHPPSQPPPPAILHPQPLQHQAPPKSHFDTAKALIARTAELEDSLMSFNIERSSLETQLAKFPSGTAGRTVVERKRKKEIEQRIEVLNKEISSVRFELRKLGIR